MKDGTRLIRDVRVGGVKASAVIAGGKTAWVPTLKITSTTTYGAQGQLRLQLSRMGLDYATITEIPFEIDVKGSTSLTSLFEGMANLSTPPLLINTEGVTRTDGMFRGCRSLETTPYVDLSNVANTSYMYDDCRSLITVAPTDTTKLKLATAMFRNTPKLYNGYVKLRGRDPFYSAPSMITGSGLTNEPWYTRDGFALALTYRTNFNYGQTSTINLDGNDGWVKYSNSGQLLQVEANRNVVAGHTTADGYFYPLSTRATTFRSNDQMVSVRWSEAWKAEASGFFLSGTATYNAKDFYLFDGSTSPKLHYSNGFWNYTGPYPSPGQLFTITKEVFGSNMVFKIYIDESLVQTINTTVQSGSRNNGSSYRKYGMHATFRRYLFGNYPGARINYFEAKDI